MKSSTVKMHVSVRQDDGPQATSTHLQVVCVTEDLKSREPRGPRSSYLVSLVHLKADVTPKKVMISCCLK